VVCLFRQLRRCADAFRRRTSGSDESHTPAPPRRPGKELADSGASGNDVNVSALSQRREGPLMKSRTTWRWNPVLGEFEAGELPPLTGSGDISAIDAFSNKTMLLLGSTGFVGKVLLAMVLARFPELKRLIVQVRRKKNTSGEQRFYSEILTSHPLRSVVEKAGGEQVIRGKVQVVEGDLDQALCGIPPDQLERLK